MNHEEVQPFLEERDLRDLLTKEESECIERCESSKTTDKIAKAICAFSNNLNNTKKSMVVFVGLKDDGKCAGLSVTDEMQRNITSIRSDGNLLPLPVISVTKLVDEQCEVIAIQVIASENPPMRYKNCCWVRVGPSVRRASEEDERLLMEKRKANSLPEDMKGLVDASIETDLNMEYFKTQYLPSSVSSNILLENHRNIKTQMRSLRLVDHHLAPTMTAILVMGINPRNWVPGAYIQFIRFEGSELTDPIKNQREISGSLPEQIIGIEELLKANVSIPLTLSEKQHLQAPDYPMTALSQIVRNAVIHRDYRNYNPIRIHWFNDRIEIQSPGGPYGEVNTNNFGTTGLTSYRNPTIAEALKNLGFVERFGFGIPQAKKSLQDNGNPEMECKPKTSTILVAIKKAR